MVYGDFKDLPGRTASDKVLHDEPLNIAKNSRYDEYQHGLASVVYNFFDKKSFSAKTSATRTNKFAGGAVKSEHYVKPRISWRITQTKILKNLKNEKYTHLL